MSYLGQYSDDDSSWELALTRDATVRATHYGSAPRDYLQLRILLDSRQDGSYLHSSLKWAFDRLEWARLVIQIRKELGPSLPEQFKRRTGSDGISLLEAWPVDVPPRPVGSRPRIEFGRLLIGEFHDAEVNLDETLWLAIFWASLRVWSSTGKPDLPRRPID
jgi:hypothetical protein